MALYVDTRQFLPLSCRLRAVAIQDGDHMATYLTTKQVADYLSVPVNTLYQWRTKQQGPCAARVGRHLRYSQTEVDRWLMAQTDTRVR